MNICMAALTDFGVISAVRPTAIGMALYMVPPRV